MSLDSIKSFFYSPEKLLRIWIEEQHSNSDKPMRSEIDSFFESLKNVEKTGAKELTKKYFACVSTKKYDPKLQSIFIQLCSKQGSEKSRFIINDLYKRAIGKDIELKED